MEVALKSKKVELKVEGKSTEFALMNTNSKCLKDSWKIERNLQRNPKDGLLKYSKRGIIRVGITYEYNLHFHQYINSLAKSLDFFFELGSLFLISTLYMSQVLLNLEHCFHILVALPTTVHIQEKINKTFLLHRHFSFSSLCSWRLTLFWFRTSRFCRCFSLKRFKLLTLQVTIVR